MLDFIDTAAPLTSADKTSPTSAPETELARPPVEESAPAEESAQVEGLLAQEFVPPRDTYRSHPELTQDFVDPGVDRVQPELDQLEVETAEAREPRNSGCPMRPKTSWTQHPRLST